MQIAIEAAFEVGRASPGFASRELVYHPLPGKLVTARARLLFRYVSADALCELGLAELLDQAPATPQKGLPHHHHPHHHDGGGHAHERGSGRG